MNTLPADPHSGFVSPLAPQLARFLALKHAMGYRYREEGRALRELDGFLNSRLSADNPVITPAIVHDYVARRGAESETTRSHRLTLIREVCRFLRLDDARVLVPDRRSLRIVRSKFVPRVLSRDEGRRFLQACAELSPGRTSPIRAVVLGTALRVLYLVGLRAGELLRLTQTDVDFKACYIFATPSSTNREWCCLPRTWLRGSLNAARAPSSTSEPAFPKRHFSLAPAGGRIRLLPFAMPSTRY
jgi:integrase